MADVNDEPASPATLDEPSPRRKASFHHGDVLNFNPNKADYEAPGFVENFFLHGWMPEAPFLTRGSKITAFGSCFAANITRHLSALGYDLSSKRDPDIYVSRLGDGMVNVASILGQFEWALEGKNPVEPLWFGFKAEQYGYDEEIRQRTRDIFLATDFFIITLGLSEIWYDEKTGETFWRAVPESAFDPSRHKFRVLSVKETRANITSIYRIIRKHVPSAKILFTVSPIPLVATFRSVSCLTANAVSKAIIRAALDEFLRRRPDELNKTLFYFPSMEIVQLGFVDPWQPDGRHPISYVLDTVMKVFEASYCVGESSLEDANAMYQMFRAENIRSLKAQRPNTAEEAAQHKMAKAAARTNLAIRKQQKSNDNELPNARKVVEKPETAI